MQSTVELRRNLQAQNAVCMIRSNGYDVKESKRQTEYMNQEDFVGKTLAILMFQEREGQEDDIHVLTGVIEQKAGVLYLHSGSERPPFQIQEEWLARIEPTPEKFNEMFSNAKLYLSLSLGPLPKDADMTEYTNTGLNLSEAGE